MNKKRQIEYWVKNADDDIETARLLIEADRILHGLFFCHLVIEKALKAHFVKTNNEIAPKTHNLLYLSDKTSLIFSDDMNIFLGILMNYQLQGRYPDYNPQIPGKIKAEEYFEKTQQLLVWLKEKL